MLHKSDPSSYGSAQSSPLVEEGKSKETKIKAKLGRGKLGKKKGSGKVTAQSE